MFSDIYSGFELQCVEKIMVKMCVREWRERERERLKSNAVVY